MGKINLVKLWTAKIIFRSIWKISNRGITQQLKIPAVVPKDPCSIQRIYVVAHSCL